MILSIKSHSLLLYILRAFASSVILIFGMGVTMAISSVLTNQFDLLTFKETLSLEKYVSGADTFFTIEYAFLISLFYGFTKYFASITHQLMVIRELIISVLALCIVYYSTFYSNQINIDSKMSYFSYLFILITIIINISFLKMTWEETDLFKLFYKFIIISLTVSIITFLVISLFHINLFELNNLVLIIILFLHCLFCILSNSLFNFLFIKTYYTYEKN